MAPTTATTLNGQSGFNPEMIIGSTTVPDKPSTTISALSTISTSASRTYTSVSSTTTGTSYSTEVTRPHWTTGHVSFRNLSVWAYLALGVIIIAVAIVLGYAIYNCCRMAVRVEPTRLSPSTGDGEVLGQGETGNANGDGGEAEDGKEFDEKHQAGCLATPTRDPRVTNTNATRNRNQDVYVVDFNGAEPKADNSELSSKRKKRFGVVDLSKLLGRVGWANKRAQGSREMKTVTPPRRNRNGWHANDGADLGMYSYPYALEYESPARIPTPAYVRGSMAQLWNEPKLSPVGGRVVVV
ncbi:hypothetical protein F5887DRAFT_1193355 [Amanita rubescens]|nr:hypothetical protein F5887DRAFT_1193355 [Amanita rubescens]